MSLSHYIQTHQTDAIYWLAERLLGNIDSPILLNSRTTELAHTIALVPHAIARDAYAKELAQRYKDKLTFKTLKAVIDDAVGMRKKVDAAKPTVRKNEVRKLDGDAHTWKFFEEITRIKKDPEDGRMEEVFHKIQIDEERFIQLLASFGFSRYESPIISSTRDDDSFQFVKLEENIIRNQKRQNLIDFVLDFVKNDYNFGKAGYHHVDANKLTNHFLRNMNKLFSKDMFARVRTDKPILINRDTKDKTFFYYRNGFVEVDKSGYRLRDYKDMNGSVWESQMKDFELPEADFTKYDTLDKMGMFADFCFKVAKQDEKRFEQLCALTGYVCHDFYDYKLKAVNITDSSLGDYSEGRTGKSLWANAFRHVRSHCAIDGKQFIPTDERKYQKAEMGTQIIHIDDLNHRGRDKFDFERLFNEITNGYQVRKLYVPPFEQQSKFILSSNKTINVQGASQRDRIIEFEWSDYFNEARSPMDEYKCYFFADWDAAEWARFHNFMAFCSRVFHAKGLQQPEAINLHTRKLINHTAQEFLDFMEDVKEALEKSYYPWEGYQPPKWQQEQTSTFNNTPRPWTEFEFDTRQTFEHFIKQNPDFKSWLTARKFIDWLRQYATHKMSIKKPTEWRTGGHGYFKFKEDPKQL